MSQFDCYTKSEYVETLRIFLREKKQNFLLRKGLLPAGYAPRRGRMQKFDDLPISKLEAEVNFKAAQAESDSQSLGDRLKIACDYKNLSISEIGNEMGVSRELARLWCTNVHKPRCLPELAEFLNVPLIWLEQGGQMHLPAHSFIGVRVGVDVLVLKEALYTKTLRLLADIPEGSDVEFIQAHIELAVMNNDDLKHLARRAGGRWQALDGTLFFTPWVPIRAHGLSRRYWTDEVEAIIKEELMNKPSVYSAWESLKRRCDAAGLSPNDYPRRISLHKRVEIERKRSETFGIDLNKMIRASLIKNSKAH